MNTEVCRKEFGRTIRTERSNLTIPPSSKRFRFAQVLRISALLLWLIPCFAHAAAPEKCGNGIDDSLQTGGAAAGTKGSCPAGFMDAVIGNGCDKKCPGIDEDNDGFTSTGEVGTAGLAYIDCNDNDRRVRPGIYVPNDWTTPTGYKLCQTNGSYSSVVLNATTPLCEATGSGVCKYVDCTSGNNANSGTYASPYQSLDKLAGGSSGTSIPSSPVTLTAGSIVYLIGGTCTDTMSTSIGGNPTPQALIAEFTQSGTSTDRITIKRYPGSSATIVTTNAAGFYASGNYYNWDDLDIQTARTSVDNALSIMTVGNYHKFTRVYIHDAAMHGDNNDSCLYCRHTNGCQIELSYFKNCNRSTGNVDNITAITWLDDDADGTGQDHYAKWVTVWDTTYSATNGVQCFKQKHGTDAADVGANKHLVQYSSCINARRAFWWEGSSLRASHNWIWGAQIASLYIVSDGGGADQADNEFTDTTIVDSADLMWNFPPYISTSQRLTMRRNVVKDIRNPYDTNNNGGIYSIHGYGSAANRTYFETNGSLISDGNCFYNPNATPVYSYFAQGSNPGGNYTLAQWRSATGNDTNSVEENPTFDANYQPTSTNCTGLGIDYTATAGGGGGGEMATHGNGGRGPRANRGRFQ